MTALVERETHTIQCFPNGASYTYQGDIDGPADQKRLQRKPYTPGPKRWSKGTADEWRQIRVNVRAKLYQDREVLACQSSLIDELLRAGFSGNPGPELRDGFSWEQVENLRPDPYQWDADQCREWLQDYQVELPDVPVIDCPTCNAPDAPTDRNTNDPVCETCKGKQEIPDPHADTDDSGAGFMRGYLAELRDLVNDHAEDAEVYEWWLVSSWLCDKLRELGEVVLDNGYGHWWGRTCTGQGMIMDGTFQRIAATFEDRD